MSEPIIYPSVVMLSHTNDPVKVVAAAAKLCYSDVLPDKLYDGLTNEEAEKFIDRLGSYGHESPFEHASFTFGISNASRSLLAQITRHRIASFSVKSQRYTDSSKAFNPICPKGIKENTRAFSLWESEMNHDLETYEELQNILHDQYMYAEMMKQSENPTNLELRQYFIDSLNLGDKRLEFHFDAPTMKNFDTLILNNLSENDSRKKLYKNIKASTRRKAGEEARSILPNACNTSMVVTMNARELSHFFEERCCRRAQDEINHLAWDMLDLCKQEAYPLFKNCGPTCYTLGKCNEGHMSCGKPYVREEKTI